MARQLVTLSVRDYIHRSLYDPVLGYFNRSRLIAQRAEPLAFSDLADQAEYMVKQQQLYRTTDAHSDAALSWTTPCNLFSPHYGAAIARALCRLVAEAAGRQSAAPAGRALRIVEIGGGTGVLARDVLDELRAHAPALYRRTCYEIVEISSSLHEQQRVLFGSTGPAAEHGGRVRLHHSSFLDFRPQVDGDAATMICAFEVLDNCAHDRLVYRAGTDWQTVVDCQLDSGSSNRALRAVRERLVPVADDTRLVRALAMMRSHAPAYSATASLSDRLRAGFERLLAFSGDGGTVRWVPTVACELVAHAAQVLPRAGWLLSDFDALPRTLEGECGPLLQAKRATGKSFEYASLLDAPFGGCDIFFPTNFGALAALLGSVRRASTPGLPRVLSHRQFMVEHASLDRTRTKSGYNPLVDDFRNVSFVLVPPDNGKADDSNSDKVDVDTYRAVASSPTARLHGG